MAQQDNGPVSSCTAPSALSTPTTPERKPKQGLAQDITDRAEAGDKEERAVAQAVMDLDSTC